MNHNEILHIWRQHCQWQRPVEDHHATTHTHNEYIMFQCYMYFSRPGYVKLFTILHFGKGRFHHGPSGWDPIRPSRHGLLVAESAHRTMACIFGCMWLVPMKFGLQTRIFCISYRYCNWQQACFFPCEQCITAVTRNRLPAAGFYFCVRHIVYINWLVTTSSRAKMAARLLLGPGPGRAFQMVTNTHCRPKSLSNFATPPFRPIIYMVFQGKDVFFYRVVGSLTDGNILLMKFSSLAALKVVNLTTLSVSMTEMSSKWQNFRFGVGSMRKKVFIIIMCYNPAPKGRIKQEPGLILLRGFYSRRKTL